MRVVVIRHHGVDSAGFIGDAFEALGAELAVHLLPDDGPLPALDGVDHVVVLGAISSVNDPDSWIAEELAWLRAADTAGVPVLGICFGAQALCAAFGGRVEAMDRREIGWTLVDSPDHDVIPPGRWLDAHTDSNASTLGIDPDRFLADTIREEPAARDRAAILVAAFLQLSR